MVIAVPYSQFKSALHYRTRFAIQNLLFKFWGKKFSWKSSQGYTTTAVKKMVGWCRPNSIVHRPFFIHVNDAQTVVNYSLWENIVIFILGGKWPNEYNIYYNGVLSFHYNCGEEFKHWTLNLGLLTHIIIIITSRLINQ